MDVRFEVRDGEVHPRRGIPGPSIEMVGFLVERELEALTTSRPSSDGLRLRVLMRMADRAVAAG